MKTIITFSILALLNEAGSKDFSDIFYQVPEYLGDGPER